MKINYQLVCDKQIEDAVREGQTPSLLLHSCCGPCSSYVLEYLSKFFKITALFHNPNVFPESEYEKRLETQAQIIEEMNFENPVSLISVPYDHKEFLECVNGLENEREGGARCEKCFVLRMRKTAEIAKQNGFDFFTTTLSVSPHKNSAMLNEIGEKLEKEIGVKFLYADFKKREGYKRSIELSKQYELYRQEYCGCEFSIPKDIL